MNKKVLSAILFSALFAGTGTFTSCIDNDEPAGIEELRGAKAELLRAKVAVEQAEASFKLAQAEVEKAKAAKQAALAKQAEATARLWEAQAEAEEAKTAQAKAAAEAAIDSIQRELEKAQVMHETTMLTQKQSLAEAQRTYEVAMKQIEIAKALMSESQKVEISSLMKDVKDLNDSIADQQVKIDARYADLKDASLIFDLDSAFEVRKAETALKVQKAALDAQVEKIAKYKKYLDNDSTLDVSAWREEIAKIEGEIAEYQKQIAAFKVDSAKALNGEERKALDKAVADANKALTAEQDTLNNMKLAGNVVDTLLWYNGVKNDMSTINIDAENVSADAAAKYLAGVDYANAEDSLDYVGVIAGLRAEHDSYTTEYKYWLDSIASSDATIAAGIKANADSAIVFWQRALAAYNAADTTVATKKAAAEKALDTFHNLASDKKNATAIDAARKAILAYYTAAKANGATFNKVPAKQARITVEENNAPVYKNPYAVEDVMTVLADTAKTYSAYVEFGVNFFAVKGANESQIETNPDYYDATAKKNVALKYYTSVIAKADKELGEGNPAAAESFLGELQTKSNEAFGLASLYVNSNAEVVALQNGYLHKQPNKEDAKFVGYNNAGKYGTYLASLDAETQYVAKNHEAIKADLKSAIDKLTALVDGIRVDTKKAQDDVTAADKVVTAAGKALSDYAQKVKDDYDNATAELDAKLTYMRRMADDLGNAVRLYLADADVYNNYQGEKLFIDHLKSQLETFEGSLIDYEYAVAKAELYLQLTKDGDFASAKNVETIKDDIAELEAKMADYVKRLAEAVEKLATAEEIWYAAE